MFNYWNPQAFNSQYGPQNMWNPWSGPQNPTPPPTYAQLFDFGNAFKSFFETLQIQGKESFNFESFENLIQSSNFIPPFLNAQFGQHFSQMPVWPQMQSVAPNLASMPSLGNIPALGLYREWQEDFAKLMLLQQQLTKCQKNYFGLFSKFSQDVAERFKKQMAEIKVEELTFDQFCRLWVDCCEDEFQVISGSDTYSSTYGALINATMRITQHTNLMVDKNARVNNMPTRSEIEQLHATQTESKDREAQLQKQVDQLESEIGRLKKNLATKTKTTATRRKTAAKTKRSTKKG